MGRFLLVVGLDRRLLPATEEGATLASMSAETILIVEDEPSVARGLEYGLKAEGFKVLLASTGGKALEIVRGGNGHSSPFPHLVLLDIRLPDMSGFDVCREIREQGRSLPILMVTARDEEVDKVLGLELGADDYIVKPFSFRELLSRLRAALRRAYGEFSFPSQAEQLFLGDVVVDLQRMRVERRNGTTLLTPTECRLLRHLASHPDRVFDREVLLELVWGYGNKVDSQRTVDVHIRHLREKVEEDPARPRWLITVRGSGYAFTRRGQDASTQVKPVKEV